MPRPSIETYVPDDDSPELSGSGRESDAAAAVIVGDNDGDRSTGKRRRRRTNGASSDPETPPVQLLLNEVAETTKPTRRARTPKGSTSPDEIAVGLSMFFMLAALIRGSHWSKSPDDCKVLGEPLAAYLDTLPNKTAKEISKWTLPISLLVGLVALLADPIRKEQELYKERKRHATERPTSTTTSGAIAPTRQGAQHAPESGTTAGDSEGFGIEGFPGFANRPNLGADSLE